MLRRLRLQPQRFRRYISTQPDPKVKIDIPQPAWHQRMGPVTTFFGWFHRTQTNRPYTVQLTATSIVYVCGDLLAQEIGGEPYNGTRTLRMVGIGLAGCIPSYKWFLFLGNHWNYSSRWFTVFVKTCIQQAVFTPAFNTYFFGMQAILAGEPPSGVIERVKNTLPTSIYQSFKMWPAVTAFSFAFVMPEYRFMFTGVFAVCWQSYLSYLNRREEKAKEITFA